MIYTASGWRYYWRRYLGWLPVQFCMVCGKWYWGGPPRWWIESKSNSLPMSLENKTIWQRRIIQTWEASWMDYCSEACAEEDADTIDLNLVYDPRYNPHEPDCDCSACCPN